MQHFGVPYLRDTSMHYPGSGVIKTRTLSR